MATRRRTSQRLRAPASVIDLTCDLDSDSEGEVLFVGEAPAPTAAPAPLREPDSPVNIVNMVVDQTLHLEPPTPPPQAPPPLQAPPAPAGTDYPRNSTETELETELTDLTMEVILLQSRLRGREPRALRSGEPQLRQFRATHAALAARVGQLSAGRRLRFEGLVRPLSAELDEMQRLVAEVRGQAGGWQQRDGGGPVRTRRSVYLDDTPPPLPADLPPESPPRASPAPPHARATAAQADKPPASPAEASGGLHCPVCLESVTSLKERQCGFLVTRCGHWFCEPCLKGACSVRRECPICRAKLRSRPLYRPLYL